MGDRGFPEFPGIDVISESRRMILFCFEWILAFRFNSCFRMILILMFYMVLYFVKYFPGMTGSDVIIPGNGILGGGK